MSKIIQITDQNEILPTSSFKLGKWDYEFFNPVQSRVCEIYESDNSSIIAASTSSGKTTIDEMYLAHEIKQRKGKGMFLVPLKALAQEKIDQWSSPNHFFSEFKISICTGDYRLDKSRMNELREADLIIMTSEMLNHKVRNVGSDENDWLKSVGTIVCDESHLLTVPNRGDHLEIGFINFSRANPNGRFVCLSATMPNVDEIGEWISESLTHKPTYVLKSEYRPVPLNIHYEIYDNYSRTYDSLELEKVKQALKIVRSHPEDKFLIFAHTKKTGEKMVQMLNAYKIDGEFHNADLTKEKRIDLENKFRNDKNFKVIVATSTLAWGINAPARRVIILGIERATQRIEPYNITQMVGRSGRLGIDTQGDAYVLLPRTKFTEYKNYLQIPQLIKSQLLNAFGTKYKTLAFHITSEIWHGNITNYKDLELWFSKSLAHFQKMKINQKDLEGTIEFLHKKNIIKINEDGSYTATKLAMISSSFYFSPFDVADLSHNFYFLFKERNFEKNDVRIALALGYIDSNKAGIVSKSEEAEMNSFFESVKIMPNSFYSDKSAIKTSYCYYCMLTGKHNMTMAGYAKNLQFDFERVAQVLYAICRVTKDFKDKKGFFTELEARVRYGVPAHLLDLCNIPNIGKVRAKKLYEFGIKTKDEFKKTDINTLVKVINLKKSIVEDVLKSLD